MSSYTLAYIYVYICIRADVECIRALEKCKALITVYRNALRNARRTHTQTHTHARLMALRYHQEFPSAFVTVCIANFIRIHSIGIAGNPACVTGGRLSVCGTTFAHMYIYIYVLQYLPLHNLTERLCVCTLAEYLRGKSSSLK